MASAISCCWAPSCRFRSILRRSASWASTSRRRDASSWSMVARSSAVSWALRMTRLAWEARCCSRLSSVLVSASSRGLLREIAPSRSSPCRTGTTARASGSRTGSSGGTVQLAPRRTAPSRPARPRWAAARRRPGSTPRPGWPRPRRPAARPSGPARRPGRAGRPCRRRSRTGPGTAWPVGRRPARLASRLARCRSGWNTSAMTTAAAMVSSGSLPLPDQRPDAEHDGRVHRGHPGRQQGDQQRAADDHVDVEQPAPQDRDRHGRRDAEVHQERGDGVRHGLQRLVLLAGRDGQASDDLAASTPAMARPSHFICWRSRWSPRRYRSASDTTAARQQQREQQGQAVQGTEPGDRLEGPDRERVGIDQRDAARRGQRHRPRADHERGQATAGQHQAGQDGRAPPGRGQPSGREDQEDRGQAGGHEHEDGLGQRPGPRPPPGAFPGAPSRRRSRRPSRSS